MRRFKLNGSLVALAATIGLLAGCGSTKTVTVTHTHTVTTPAAANAPQSQLCKPGQAYMGCATGVTKQTVSKEIKNLTGKQLKAASSTFVDVYEGQGCSINWSQVGVRGAGVKAFESRQDSCFAHNVTSLKAAHKVWVPYDFVTSCSSGPGFIAAIRSVGGLTSGPAVLDEEVRGASSCTSTLAHQIFNAFHRWPTIYTAPGTWSGGPHLGLALWVATYGSHYSSCFFSDGCATVTAWQDAAPPFCGSGGPTGCLVIGGAQVDTDIDKGMLEASPKPVNVWHYERYGNVPVKTKRWGVIYEVRTVKAYDQLRPHWRQHHKALLKLRYEMQSLSSRLSTFQSGKHPYRLDRIQELNNRGSLAVQCKSWLDCVKLHR